MSRAASLVLAALVAGLAASTAAAQPPATATRDFVAGAAQSDQYEISAGQTALAESRDPNVRAFAQEMIRDHTHTTEALQQATASSGLPPPPPGMGDQSKMLNALQSLTGPDFDKAYARQQVLAHESALVVEQGYASTGADPNVRRAAQQAVPIIQHHLEMARQMRSALGGG